LPAARNLRAAPLPNDVRISTATWLSTMNCS
jgi:hypothetical protein